MMTEALEMSTHEMAIRLVTSSQAEVIHECPACHRQFTLAAWRRLHLLTKPHAPTGRYSGLEWRNCPAPCSSTLTVEVEILDAD